MNKAIIPLTIITIILSVIISAGSCYSSQPYEFTAVIQPVNTDTVINITTDENGTVYIVIRGLTIYNFTKTQVVIGYYNVSYIFVSYTSLYINSPENESIPIIVKIYNKSGDNVELKYVFNATDFSSMMSKYSNLIVKTEYYNVSGFEKIYYEVYDARDNSLLYSGEMNPPPESTASTIYSNEYMSYLASLVPLALLIMFAGRGSMKDIGIGLIVYGITTMILPYIGIYPAYSMYIFPLALILGVIILFFSK